MTHIADDPNGKKRVLYFEAHNCDGEELERAFPITTDADKLALSELIITGELNELLGIQHSAGWTLRLVKMPHSSMA